jgi:hypothetical protein
MVLTRSPKDGAIIQTTSRRISKGQRVIMVHEGGKDGFIPNALLIFKSGVFILLIF